MMNKTLFQTTLKCTEIFIWSPPLCISSPIATFFRIPISVKFWNPFEVSCPYQLPTANFQLSTQPTLIVDCNSYTQTHTKHKKKKLRKQLNLSFIWDKKEYKK